MNRKRFIGIILICCGFLISFMTYKYIDGKISYFGGIPITILGIMLIVYSFEYKSHSSSNVKPHKISRPHISEEHLIKEYMSEGMNSYLDCLLKIYFNRDYTQRIIFIRKNNEVLVKKQKLYFFDDSEYEFTKELAYWEEMRLSNSFYGNLEIALKENEVELRDFSEEDNNFMYLNNNKKHIVEVTWNSYRKTGIPTSIRYRPNISLTDKPDESRGVTLINVGVIKENLTKSVLYYLISRDTKQDTLPIGTLINIFEGANIVGKAIVVGYLD